MIGIYSITNLADNKRYIGQSVNIKTRIGQHKSFLKYGKHKNLHLQHAFTKYGAGRFRFDVLCECLENELDDQERYWIQYYKTTDMNCGYNLNTGGSLYRRVTDEVRAKLKERWKSRKGRRQLTQKRTREEFLTLLREVEIQLGFRKEKANE
jgi:group I intron endonuclease